MFSTPSACALSAVMAALASSDSSVSATLLAPRSGEAPEDKSVANTFECQCKLELTAALSSHDNAKTLLQEPATGFPIVRSCDDPENYMADCDFSLQAKSVSIQQVNFGKTLDTVNLDLVLPQPNMYVCDWQTASVNPKCSNPISAGPKEKVILRAGPNGQGSVCKSLENKELWSNLVKKVTCGVQQTTTPAPKPETTAPYNALGCDCKFTFKEEEAAADAEPKKVIGSFSPLTYKNGSKIDYRAWLVDDKHNMSKFSLNQDGSASFVVKSSATLPLGNFFFSSDSTPILPSQTSVSSSLIVDVVPLQDNTMIMIGNEDDSKNLKMDINDGKQFSFCNENENDLQCQLKWNFAASAVHIQSLDVLPKTSTVSLQVSTTVDFYICKVDPFHTQGGVTCFHIDSALGFSAESKHIEQLCNDMSKSWADIVPKSTTIECAKVGGN